RDRAVWIGVEDAVELSVFRAGAPQIVPDAPEDGLDLRRGFLRKGGGEIAPADAAHPETRPDAPGDEAAQAGGPVQGQQPHQPEGTANGGRLEGVEDPLSVILQDIPPAGDVARRPWPVKGWMLPPQPRLRASIRRSGAERFSSFFRHARESGHPGQPAR